MPLSPVAGIAIAKNAVSKHSPRGDGIVNEATIIGVDLAKNVFQLHGAATNGSVVFRK